MAVVKRGDVSLYYEVVGDGPAVTFAHGAGGNAASWYQQVPYFCQDYKTLAFDHRAFARSQCSADDFLIAEFADDLKAILDDAGIERTALVCQSMGGWTGIRFALAYPDRLSCIVMSHTTGGITNEVIRAAMADIARTRATPPEPFGSLAIASDLPDKDPVKANLYNQIGNFNVIVNLDKIMGGLGGRLAGTSEAELENFAVPIMFVTADMDVLIPPAAIREAARLLGDAPVHEFSGIGHSSYFEAPEAFNEVASSFIARHNRE